MIKDVLLNKYNTYFALYCKSTKSIVGCEQYSGKFYRTIESLMGDADNKNQLKINSNISLIQIQLKPFAHDLDSPFIADLLKQ
jgi:hypothetical protein